MKELDPEQVRRLRDGEAVVRYEARRQRRRLGRLIELDEAEAMGRVALAEALQTFDPALGTFGGYVRQKVIWAILDGVRRNAHDRRAAAGARVLLAVEAALRTHQADSETAGALTEDTQQAMLATLLDDGMDALGLSLVAVRDTAGIAPAVATPEEQFARAQQSELLFQAIEQLPERERTVVRRYLGDETLTAIADDLGVNKSSASRTLDRAFKTLARALGHTR